ncbi:MAG: hypothetical protein HY516_01505 [Candidatus Aenigmarchaeota archaeon]|nr:hypothetical protein [Candidatus Aenigmarchaeota archaeon]
MKGYIHTVEMILSFLIVLATLTQFSSLYSKEAPWARNYLYLLSKDVVYTANFLGDDWQNSSFVSTTVDKILFSDSIEYEFGLKNALKREVIAGCFCTPAELANLRARLSELNLNGKKLSFRVSDMAAVQNWNSLDVIMYGHYQNMDPDKQKILDFLAGDKGIVLLSPVTQAQITADSVLRDVFGLKWVTNPVGGGPANGVLVPTHPQNRSYAIKKYFYGFRSANIAAPLRCEADIDGPCETDLDGPISCTNSTHEGSINTRGSVKKFWIMDASGKTGGGNYCDYVVYVDENSNSKADDGEGPHAAGSDFILNGFSMRLKSINTQAYNEKAESEAGAGWALASANGLCTGDGDDVCSESDALWTDTRNSVATMAIDVKRPDRYEVWLRSWRGTDPKEKEMVYTASVDGGAEVLIDPFHQRDPDFEGPWGWNRVENPAGFTVLLDAGPHAITLRTPTAGEEPKWKSSAVDWIFLRNTTFTAKNSVEFLFSKDYKFSDFSEVGPFPDDNKVERISTGSEKKYSMPPDNAPVASAIVKDGITDRKAGRAAWVAATPDGDDVSTLLRAVVAWAAPKEFINVQNPSLGGSASQAYTVFENGDMSNPYQILVTLWYSRRF